jgi:hypothetical protein
MWTVIDPTRTFYERVEERCSGAEQKNCRAEEL